MTQALPNPTEKKDIVREFFATVSVIPAKTPIYVDLNLENENGIDVSRKVSSAGFSLVYLATGANKADVNVEAMPFIAGVLDKSPPWVETAV